jgi:tRNA(fMet)-specific endonuclease VapC
VKYILDSDTLIYFLKGQRQVVDALSRRGSTELSTTIINHSELFFGAFNSTKKSENIEIIRDFFKAMIILPFCEASSLIFAEQKALLKKQGNIVADMDLMIASISLKHKAILVTNNTQHFTRIKNLKLENWSL